MSGSDGRKKAVKVSSEKHDWRLRQEGGRQAVWVKASEVRPRHCLVFSGARLFSPLLSWTQITEPYLAMWKILCH